MICTVFVGILPGLGIVNHEGPPRAAKKNDLTQRRKARGEELEIAGWPLRTLRLCVRLDGLGVATILRVARTAGSKTKRWASCTGPEIRDIRGDLNCVNADEPRRAAEGHEEE